MCREQFMLRVIAISMAFGKTLQSWRYFSGNVETLLNFMEKVKTLLDKIFKNHPKNFSVKIWDGRVISWNNNPKFMLIFKNKRIFKKIMASADLYIAGEAFIENNIDIEGDVFAAVRLGDYLSQIKLTM